MMTEAQLQAIHEGFDERVAQSFEAERGKPFKPAPIQKPLTPQAGNFARYYSWSIMDFATRCFRFNEQIDEANAALVENARHYIDHPKDIVDIDSFHWHSEMLCRLIEFYGTHGSIAPGRLKPETEAIMMEPIWSYVTRWNVPGESDPRNTYPPHTSDNHHTMHFITKWHFAKLAKDHPLFKDRKYPDGSTPAEQYEIWSKFIKAYCLDHARMGLFAEFNSDNYNVVGSKGFYNVYDFADDPALKRVAGYFLDLYWAMWAQEQIDGVRGGGKARIYQYGQDLRGDSEVRQLAWFYFGIGQPRRPVSPFLAALTSTYRPPLVVIDIALDVGGRGRYEVIHRPLGTAQSAYYLPRDNPPEWPMLGEKDKDSALLHNNPLRLPDNPKNWPEIPETGNEVCYSWCTPDFILGTPMVEPKPAKSWPGVSAQNRWHGVIFAGDINARIVPQAKAPNRGAKKPNPRNSEWSVQRKGSFICQKLKTSMDAEEMQVWFSKPGLTTPTLENGWLFVEAPKAYAAVRVVTGAADLVPAEEKPAGLFITTPAGYWLKCRDEWSPVILEVASKNDFPNYEAFQSAASDLPISFENNVLNYQGLSGDKLTFYADQTRNPEINGEPVNYAPSKVLDSPFLQSDWGSGVVTITKEGRKAILDFN